MNNPISQFSCMWVGGELPRIAWLSLSSAIHHGYEPRIYLYDQGIKVPHGAVKCDANEIVSKDDVFLRHGRYTNFSDLFRYSLMHTHDSVWFDLDCIFLNDRFPTYEPHVFSYETYDPLIIGTGILKYPPQSALSAYLLQNCISILDEMKPHIEDGNWSVFGPELFTEAVTKFGFLCLAKPQEFMCPIGWMHDELKLLIDPDMYEIAINRVNSSYRMTDAHCSAIHVWASSIDMNFSSNQFDKFGAFPEGSLLWHYDKMFRIENSA